ncbi:MAG: hypothetical protein KAR20_19480 [Candidatus Heimdallarchaeota archaeon]|nr:hypothetical protein [Candidatus Heimdallarchaeota archaeon]
MSEKKLEKTLLKIGAYWKHNCNMENPHSLLASGKHSDGFLNLSILASFPTEMRAFTDILTQKITEVVSDYENLWVIGSAMGGIPVAMQVAENLKCNCAYTEKSDNGVMKFKRFESESDRIGKVLLIEDVVTTGSTTQKTVNTLCKHGLKDKILPYFCTIVNRTGKNSISFKMMDETAEFQMINALSINFNVWNAKDCPLCKAGSEAQKPKKNWQKFRNDAKQLLY